MMHPVEWAALPAVEKARRQAAALLRYRRETVAAVDETPIERCPDCGAWVYRPRPCRTCEIILTRPAE